MFLVLGFRGAWVSHAPPRVPRQRSGSLFAGSPAWQGLPQCPGYGHWVSYCCVVLVLWFGLRGNPANPGWRLGWVCLATDFRFSPPFLAGARGVCSWAWVLACIPPFLVGVWAVRGCVRALPVPRHSRLGSVVWVFVLCLGCGCAPPLLAGVLGGVRVCVCAPSLPRHSWLGCAVWVCVLGPGLWLRPSTPGWGVGVCVCLCARSACTPPLLAEVCGVGVCAWAWVSAAPCQFWLGCWGVCVFVSALRLYPATSGWKVGVWVCVLGLGFRLRPTTPGWGVGVWVCWCVRSTWSPAPPGWGCRAGMCDWAWASAAPRNPWLGCLGVCMFVCGARLYPATPGWVVRCGSVCLGSGFGLRPATPCWGVGVCVCSCACSASTPPLLAGCCVCVWVSVSPALRFFLACVLGRVASCVRRVPFLSPSGVAVCRVGMCGSCRGWGLSPPSPLVFFLFRVRGGCDFRPCRVVVFRCPPLPVLVLGLSVSVPPSPVVWAAPMVVFFFARYCSSGVCVGVSGVFFSLAGRCSRLGVARFRRAVLRCSFRKPRGCCLRCCLAGGFARLLWSGCVASRLCACLLPLPFFFPVCLFPPPFFLWGGVCLFLPLPSLGWCTHWSAFVVVNRVAFGACGLLGRAPAPWVGWVMYTLGPTASPLGLGSRSAGWAVAPIGFLRPWVRGSGVFRVPLPLSCQL